MRALFAVLLSLASFGPSAAPPLAGGGDPFAAALVQAQARRVPVLVDFTAPWCYSCYYMAKNVLNGPEWDRAHRETVVIELDADSPEGSRLMAVWGVKAMPTYLVFNAEGAELGRVLGEQTRADFYAWLFRTTGRDSLEALKAKVADASPASVASAREVLRAYHARYDATGGLAWFLARPAPVRGALASDDEAALWVARLELQRAAAENDVAGCANVAPMVLDSPLGCERPYEVDKVLACTEKLPESERRLLLRPQVEPMQLLVDKRVLAPNPGITRCADERSTVIGAADVYQALGNAAAEKRVLDAAIEDLKARIGGDPGSSPAQALRKDRNMSDNLRVYLERAGRVDELDQMFPLLIEAYPDDYVYPYRQARSLASRGRHAEALPLYERAAEKTYGVNKLRIAELRARSLQALNRTDEARAVLDEALAANGPWFPEDAAKLKALRESLSPA